MKHLFNDWERVERLIKKSPHRLFLADYDGTLTPIAPRPEGAVMAEPLRGMIKRLSEKRGFSVGIISGRRLSEVKSLVGLSGLYYAGNHGFEIKGPGIFFLHPAVKRYKRFLDDIKRSLLSGTRGIRGVIIEYKGASLSLHYRMVGKKYTGRLRAIFKKICLPYLKDGRIRITSGKKVWEVRMPVNWDKGSAVKKILEAAAKRSPGQLPIYIGDDKTDEDAFLYLKNKKSVTVFIGGRSKKSAARYYLDSPREVKEFMVRLCRT